MPVSSRTVWGVVALAAAAGIAAMWMPQGRSSRAGRRELDARVDDALDDSFPASDPPSFSAPAAAQPADAPPV